MMESLGKGVVAPQECLLIDKPFSNNDLRLLKLAQFYVKNPPLDFLRHVQLDGECWLWTGAKQPPYGKFHGFGAHRAAYQFFRGEIPAGQCVLHRCDRPPCVNPDHLFLGTRAENCLDRTRKNRSACKLTPAQVQTIRRLRRDVPKRCRPYLDEIASEYGVTVGAISQIVNGQRRKHVPAEASS